ncbi:MAG: response regulator transcription factor [Crocinitomicaceae bacterium]|nr:MAG: response regulator transcription factor [Crocinitomicaceae bacterium]
MNYLIIEDEVNAVLVVKSYVERFFPEMTCLGDFDKISTACEFLKENKVDFIFLDVQLNGEIGIDIVKYLPKEKLTFEIIFTTAYSGFALEAFALCAIDYLLKPLKEDRFVEAIERVIKKNKVSSEQLELLQYLSKAETIDKIILKNSEGQYPIQLNEIVYLKADNVYTEFYLLTKKRIVVSRPLKEYELLLTNTQFFKPHRSYIINTAQIAKILVNEIEMKDQTMIPLARDKKRELELFLK